MKMAERIIEIDVSDIALWIALAIFLALLAWWVLGASPTIEQISLGIAALGVWLTFKTDNRLAKVEQGVHKQVELSEKILGKVEGK
jgi:membrane protein required for beta-lactamase induction